jgi:hypothetical protein
MHKSLTRRLVLAIVLGTLFGTIAMLIQQPRPHPPGA